MSRVSRKDNSGYIWNVVGGAIGGAIIGAVSEMASQAINRVITGEAINWGDVLTSAIGGAVYGGLIAATGNETIASVASEGTMAVINGMRAGDSLGKIAIDTTIAMGSAAFNSCASKQINTYLASKAGKTNAISNLAKWCTDDVYRGKFEASPNYVADAYEYSTKALVVKVLNAPVKSGFRWLRNLAA